MVAFQAALVAMACVGTFPAALAHSDGGGPGILAIFPSYNSTGNSDGRQLKEDARFSELQLHAPAVCTAGSPNVARFYSLAHSASPSTDKVDPHSYQLMYGMYLGSLRHQHVKMLEIGLGCNMQYGPGASVALWKKFLPNLDLWEAEYDAECVKAKTADGALEGVSTLVGDQGNYATLDHWVAASTQDGNFNVIVDDGGHKNSQIMHSFEKLWPVLEPGGLYFMEDLQVGRRPQYDDTRGEAVVSDIIQSWVEQLLIKKNNVNQTLNNQHKHKKPAGIAFISCQHEACVIGKHQTSNPTGRRKKKKRNKFSGVRRGEARLGEETVASLIDQVEGFLAGLDGSRKGFEQGDDQGVLSVSVPSEALSSLKQAMASITLLRTSVDELQTELEAEKAKVCY